MVLMRVQDLGSTIAPGAHIANSLEVPSLVSCALLGGFVSKDASNLDSAMARLESTCLPDVMH